MTKEKVPEVLNKVTDLVLKYRPKEKIKKPRERKKVEPKVKKTQKESSI
jgi:hypothetical protein